MNDKNASNGDTQFSIINNCKNVECISLVNSFSEIFFIKEISYHIIDKLNIKDFVSFISCNKMLRTEFISEDYMWRFLYMRDCGNIKLADYPEFENKDTKYLRSSYLQEYKTVQALKRIKYHCDITEDITFIHNSPVLKIHNKLINITSDICYLKRLEVIALNRACLECIPSEIGSLKNLRTINFSSNKIKNIPFEIFKLTSLENLDFSHNLLSEIPGDIIKLTNLKSLHLYSNNITCAKNIFVKLPKLQVLYLTSNKIKHISQDVTNLKNLINLCLGNNSIKDIPVEVFYLTNLTILDLTRNKISKINISDKFDIGTSMGKSLEQLRLNYNKLKCIPSVILQLRNLRFLGLDDNEIEQMPEDINLPMLTDLKLNNNRITKLYPCLLKLPRLRYLYLSNNFITEIPEEVSPSLRKIFVNGNDVKIITKASTDTIRKLISNPYY